MSLGGELQRLIGAGHVRVAIALWRRHASPSLAAVAADAITAIPVTTPVRSFVPWLRDEVVPLLDVAQRRRLSSWLARRAVEVEARTGSPHHALLLATVLGGATAGVLYDLAGRGGDRSIAAACYRSDFVRRLPTPAQAVHRAITGRAAFAPLVAAHVANRRAARGVSSGGGDGDGDGGLAAGMDSPLARVCALLSSLVYLHDVHGLALNLDQIKRDTAAGIGVALLDREDNPAALGGVDVDDHVSGGGAIDVHVRPWCRRHGVDCDALLFTYVAELCTAIVGSDEVLESRCLAVLLCIQDSAVRVDAAMALLQVRMWLLWLCCCGCVTVWLCGCGCGCVAVWLCRCVAVAASIASGAPNAVCQMPCPCTRRYHPHTRHSCSGWCPVLSRGPAPVLRKYENSGDSWRSMACCVGESRVAGCWFGRCGVMSSCVVCVYVDCAGMASSTLRSITEGRRRCCWPTLPHRFTTHRPWQTPSC